jgi:hypothetical protein
LVRRAGSNRNGRTKPRLIRVRAERMHYWDGEEDGEVRL